jgi:hypothetical protein
MNVLVRYQNGGQPAVCRLESGQHTVGRDASCTIRLDDPDVSRCHLQIDVRQDEVVIHDPGSVNGTWRRRHRIEHLRLPRWPIRLRLGPNNSVVLWASPMRTIVRTAHVGAGLAACAMFILALAYNATEGTTKRTCAGSVDMETRLRRAAAAGDSQRALLLAHLCRNPARP